jgi:hypothetical protein
LVCADPSLREFFILPKKYLIVQRDKFAFFDTVGCSLSIMDLFLQVASLHAVFKWNMFGLFSNNVVSLPQIFIRSRFLATQGWGVKVAWASIQSFIH